MEKQYIIESRYETFLSNGKKFIDWFVYDTDPVTEKEAKEKIKNLKKIFGYIDVKTKLKHEYRLKDNDEYIKEFENFKKEIEEQSEKQKAYFKSNEYKELQKKKRQAAKERKERQKKYLEEHVKS